MKDLKTIGTDAVLIEVAAERARQDEKHGVQNHPDQAFAIDVEYYEGKASDWKTFNAARASSGATGWDGVLLHQVYEACAETDAARLRAELVQVAATAVCWIEAIDRRGGSR